MCLVTNNLLDSGDISRMSHLVQLLLEYHCVTY